MAIANGTKETRAASRSHHVARTVGNGDAERIWRIDVNTIIRHDIDIVTRNHRRR
jgi:hypothetical protein